MGLPMRRTPCQLVCCANVVAALWFSVARMAGPPDEILFDPGFLISTGCVLGLFALIVLFGTPREWSRGTTLALGILLGAGAASCVGLVPGAEGQGDAFMMLVLLGGVCGGFVAFRVWNRFARKKD
jgi:hypothetical protein